MWCFVVIAMNYLLFARSLDNGYVIKIGRGLNYFKPAANKYSLGYFDYRLRECMECNVDILYCQENRSKKLKRQDKEGH